ncbi:HNH endonuclease [Lysinibacillus sp. NPDC097287]|uniref:HNH endonuclease n=1 Tax=Lysinibacillus sp. NPDC097287 TaxID=3364144 RepID=UPI0037F6CB6C
MDKITHNQILRKFNAYKGKRLSGAIELKNLPADEYVDQPHILNDLVRGFYKPSKENFILSFRPTEKIENYGPQIIWEDEENGVFKEIRMLAPNKEKDVRKAGDIRAAEFNMANHIPVGIIQHFAELGAEYRILGLGLIVEKLVDRGNIIFLVKPLELSDEDYLDLVRFPDSSAEQSPAITSDDSSVNNDISTEGSRLAQYRVGQQKFKALLLNKFDNCQLCSIKAKHCRASHIKPWKSSNNRERLDVNNGLLLCPNHDHLFDRGLITFNNDGKILISDNIDESSLNDFRLNADLRIEMSLEKNNYMAYHRNFKYIQN